MYIHLPNLQIITMTNDQFRILIPNLHQALFLLALVLSMAIAASQNPLMSKPGCMDHCGNIPIPFPFGTSPDCYHSFTFWVICNTKVQNPPKLFWHNTTIEIKKISLDGQMTVMNFVSINCVYPNGNSNKRNPMFRLINFFTVNNTANKFTIVGCDGYGFVYGRQTTRRRYSTGCTASCTNAGDLEEGSCMGTGCCQTAIPPNVSIVNITVSSYNNYSKVRNVTNCTSGFLVEASAFRFYKENLTNIKGGQRVPMVIDWTFDNQTCGEAKSNTSGYGCKSKNSLCFEPEYGDGYRCRCMDGYHGNPYLTGGCQDIDECNPGPGQNKSCPYICVNKPGGFDCHCPKGYRRVGRTIAREGDCQPNESRKPMLIAAGIPLVVIIMLLIACLTYLVHNQRQSQRVKKKCFLQNGGDLLLDRVKIFSYSELKKATNDFHKDNIVGQGGFGTVYRGLLLNNQIVAIKKSKRVDVNQIDQFVHEVLVLSQMNHRNIVKLLGCCLETEIPHLVYEFINNGTLYTHLHDPRRACLLNWENRLRIATETAGVLAYLHSAASEPIIHRDVKSENILLDMTFTAKVADFGASRLIPLDQTQVSTVVQGTTGYLDPEYLLTHQLTAKSDVYSFGVVLLEMITGRSAVSFSGPEEERSLVRFSMSAMKQDNFFLLVDRCIATDQNKEQIMEVARIAKWCVQMKGEERPGMKVVAMELENLTRFERKQSLVETKQNGTEMETLLYEGFSDIIGKGGDSCASTSGSNSYVDQVAPSMSGGR